MRLNSYHLTKLSPLTLINNSKSFRLTLTITHYPTSALSLLNNTYSTSTIDNQTWDKLSLLPSITHNLFKLGLVKPTEIQTKVIPQFLTDDTMVVTAETGSGKTLAYVAPLVHKLIQVSDEMISEFKHPLAVILVPSKELVWQVASTIKSLSPVDSNIEVVFNRLDIKESNPDRKKYILITTPAALIQRTQAENKLVLDSLQAVRYVIVDEVDILLSGTFGSNTQKLLNHFKRIESHLCQFMFIGASLNPSTSKQSFRAYLNKKFPGAQFINSNKAHHTVDGLKESFIYLNDPIENSLETKAIEIVGRLTEHALTNKQMDGFPRLVLIFLDTISRTIELHSRVSEYLTDPNIKLMIFHKDIPRKTREDQLKQLKFGDYSQELVAVFTTDIMARGLDFPNLDLIIQADFPTSVTSYLHRAGRTARAGRTGTCISFITPQDTLLAKEIETIASLKQDESIPSSDTNRTSQLSELFSRRRSINRKLKRQNETSFSSNE